MTDEAPPAEAAARPSLPPGTVRVFLSLALSVLAAAAAARPPLASEARTVVVLVVAATAALSARSSLLLIAARRGLLAVDDAAPRHRLLLASGPAALLGAFLATPLLVLPPVHARFEVLVGGLLGAGAGVVLAAVQDRRPKGPRTTTLFRWLVLDTALPAGIVAALFGVCFAFLRLRVHALVAPGELARHLGATTFFYALLLGLGGFFKAYGEQSAGLVVVPKQTAQVPGPVVVGGVLGIALLLVVGRVAPALPLDTVLAIKAAAGLVVGGGLSLLGALQGARAASLGLGRARQGRAQSGAVSASVSEPSSPDDASA